MIIQNATAADYAHALGKLLSEEQLADLFNAMVGCEADGRLTDREVVLLDELFGAILKERPNVADLAATR
jgi:hypothetical protein